jgi:acylphosphatase/5-bromo-4-chloroindolyl phosphate hydrolysis protein
MIKLSMKRIVAVAKGDVQRVGYRDEVEKAARELGLTGYVENVKPYDVRIVAEGDEEKLKLFMERIKIRKYPVFVENIEVSWQDATGEFSFFEIRRGEWTEELFERLDTAGRFLYRTVELGEKSVELGEKNVALSEKAVKLAEKNVELGEKSVELTEKAVKLGERNVELAEKAVELSKRNVELTEKAVKLGERNVELTEKAVELSGKSVGLGEKAVSIGEETLRAIREESEKTRSVIKDESEKTREEIRLLRIDLREYIEESLKEIRVKILEIENALRKAGIM